MKSEGINYVLEPTKSPEELAIVAILDHPYEGVRIRFGVVSFSDPDDDGTVTCSYDYDLIEGNGKDTDSEGFNAYLSDILHSMMVAAAVVDNDTTIMEGLDNVEEVRETDYQEPDDERGLLS